MLYYIHCLTCSSDSPLLLESELETLKKTIEKPTCNTCGPLEWVQVEVRQKFAFYFGCMRCKGSWKYFTPSTYSDAKAKRPNCPTCGDAQEVYFLPPELSLPKLEKRERPGLLDPVVYPPKRHRAPEVKESPRPKKRRRTEDEADMDEEAPETLIEPVDEEKVAEVMKAEAAYRFQRRRQKRFDAGLPVDDQRDPRKASKMTGGRLIQLSEFETKFKHRSDVKGTDRPRPMKSGPTVVNSVRILPRSDPWDYREVAPGSFLRRLSSLLYVINFGVDDRANFQAKGQEAQLKAATTAFEREKEKFKPVEVQAMWAAGSLYLASNSWNYSDALVRALAREGTVKALIGALNLGKGGTYRALDRNFTKNHMAGLRTYQDAIVANTETSYRTYFLYRWVYVFEQLRAAMDCTQIARVTIARSKGDYTTWTIDPGDRTLPDGRVFVVIPDTGTPSTGKFVEKGVHAEQLFYPILMALDAQGRLTPESPAWVGGVKTACFTCASVMKAAADALGDKFMGLSDAVGNYWEASGQHVTKTQFQQFAAQAPSSIVFTDNPTTINVLDTEYPMSPPGSPKID